MSLIERSSEGFEPPVEKSLFTWLTLEFLARLFGESFITFRVYVIFASRFLMSKFRRSRFLVSVSLSYLIDLEPCTIGLRAF